MYIFKQFKDSMRKRLLGDTVPRELLELHQYFRHGATIDFDFHKEDGEIVAQSTNFSHGSIITSATTKKELDANIKDAILTAFGVPAVYAKDAAIVSDKQKSTNYAIA